MIPNRIEDVPWPVQDRLRAAIAPDSPIDIDEHLLRIARVTALGKKVGIERNIAHNQHSIEKIREEMRKRQR